ncbi:DNA excision repair protein ERCC-1-like protein [Dinothrombium tinctorium]|uniref:DNA excision repair protein ERCC-1-like protein n=1 Tax=Dinothrombium tinctorium TaxID=1965070 RepID=A0A3S3PVN6_9ACAR|nr:DNA excision repair protein ERCC-1-like protein [Dinothrombium tinctorium]
MAKPNTVIVNRKQRGNLLLKSIKNVNWDYGDIEADYMMGEQTCALFLSLKYHNLYPTYIYERLKSLGKAYKLQVLLVLVDVVDPNAPLKEMANVAILSECTLICVWSYEEAGRVIETYKMFEHKSPQIIMEKQLANANGTEGNYKCAIEALSSVKSISKTDAISLISTFECMQKIVKSTPEQLALCTGLGPQKVGVLYLIKYSFLLIHLQAERLYQLFRRPFKRD